MLRTSTEHRYSADKWALLAAAHGLCWAAKQGNEDAGGKWKRGKEKG